MATLVEVSRQLSQQGSILQDTNRSIEEMLRVVQNQLSFFTKKEAGDRLQNLEDERERQRDSRPQTPMLERLTAAVGGPAPGSLKDFFRQFGAGFAGLLGLVTGATFAALRKLLKGGIVLSIFPFIKDFADSLSTGVIDVVDDFLEDFLKFEMTEDQKKIVRSALGEGIKTAVVAKLLGAGVKTSLIAGVIGAAFDAVSKLFPDFGEYVETTYNDVLAWLRGTGDAGIAAANFIDKNPELMKTAFAIASAVLVTKLIPAAFTLGGTIIASVFAKMALLFAGAKVVAGASGLTLLLGGSAIALVTAGVLGYIFEDEIKSTLKSSMDKLFEGMESVLTQINDYVNSTMVNTIDKIRNFVLGIDIDQVAPEVLEQKDQIREQLNQLYEDRRKAIAAALVNAGITGANIYDADKSKERNEIANRIYESFQAKEDQLNYELDLIQQRIDIQGTQNREIPLILGGKSKYSNPISDANLQPLELETFGKTFDLENNLAGLSSQELYNKNQNTFPSVSDQSQNINQQINNVDLNNEQRILGENFRHLLKHGFIGAPVVGAGQ